MTQYIINNIPRTTDEIHAWCLYSAVIFCLLSVINHLFRGEISKFGTLVAMKQSISGLTFPYSFVMMFIIIDKSILQTITDVERFLSIAGIVLTILSISILSKIG
jgi:hypothetical protein